MHPLRNLLCIAAILGSAVPAFAQRTAIQQLTGGYLGVTANPKGGTPLAASLSIKDQFGRGFGGTLGYVEQDNLVTRYIEQENLAVAGLIARDGQCGMLSLSDNSLNALALNWHNFGNGAASLVGQNVADEAPIAFLRPFAEPGITWKDGPAQAQFLSSEFGVPFASQFDIENGKNGRFQASFTIGRESFTVIGTSSTLAEVAIVGVSSNLIIQIAGQLQTNPRTGEITLQGTYQITTPDGNLFDTGIIAVLIG